MNFIDHIQPQLDEFIDGSLSFGYTPDELLQPLTNTLRWWEHRIYSNALLHAEHADMSFVGWLNAAEFLGCDVEALNVALIAAIRVTVERQWEIRLDDMQRDYNRELERTVGKEVAA